LEKQRSFKKKRNPLKFLSQKLPPLDLKKEQIDFRKRSFSSRMFELEEMKRKKSLRWKIMIVDDNQLLRKTCKQMIKITSVFKKHKFKIISAKNGLDVIIIPLLKYINTFGFRHLKNTKVAVH
jgi:hypothetical protein